MINAPIAKLTYAEGSKRRSVDRDNHEYFAKRQQELASELDDLLPGLDSVQDMDRRKAAKAAGEGFYTEVIATGMTVYEVDDIKSESKTQRSRKVRFEDFIGLDESEDLDEKSLRSIATTAVESPRTRAHSVKAATGRNKSLIAAARARQRAEYSRVPDATPSKGPSLTAARKKILLAQQKAKLLAMKRVVKDFDDTITTEPSEIDDCTAGQEVEDKVVVEPHGLLTPRATPAPALDVEENEEDSGYETAEEYPSEVTARSLLRQFGGLVVKEEDVDSKDSSCRLRDDDDDHGINNIQQLPPSLSDEKTGGSSYAESLWKQHDSIMEAFFVIQKAITGRTGVGTEGQHHLLCELATASGRILVQLKVEQKALKARSTQDRR